MGPQTSFGHPKELHIAAFKPKVRFTVQYRGLLLHREHPRPAEDQPTEAHMMLTMQACQPRLQVSAEALRSTYHRACPKASDAPRVVFVTSDSDIALAHITSHVKYATKVKHFQLSCSMERVTKRQKDQRPIVPCRDPSHKLRLQIVTKHTGIVALPD